MNIQDGSIFSFSFKINVLPVAPFNSPLGEFQQIFQQIIGGSGAAKTADMVYGAKRTVTASGTPDLLDLNGGTALVGSDRATAFSVTRLVSIAVVNLSTVQQIIVGGSGHTITTFLTGTNPGIVLPPSYDTSANLSWFGLNCPTAAGFGVTASTGDTFRVATNGGSNVPYLIYLLGATT